MPTNNRVDDVNTIDNCRQGQQRQWPRPSPHRHRSTIVAPATRATCHHNHNNSNTSTPQYTHTHNEQSNQIPFAATRQQAWTERRGWPTRHFGRCFQRVAKQTLFAIRVFRIYNKYTCISLAEWLCCCCCCCENNNQPCQRKPSSMRAGLCSNRWIGPCVNRSSPQRTLSTAYLHKIINIDYEYCYFFSFYSQGARCSTRANNNSNAVSNKPTSNTAHYSYQKYGELKDCFVLQMCFYFIFQHRCNTFHSTHFDSCLSTQQIPIFII